MATHDVWPHEQLPEWDREGLFSYALSVSLHHDATSWTWIASDSRDMWIGTGPGHMIVVALLGGVWQCL